MKNSRTSPGKGSKQTVMKKALHRAIVVLILLLLWQTAYWLSLFPKILFPSLADIGEALLDGFRKDDLLASILFSFRLIACGLGTGIAAGFALSALAVLSGAFSAACDTMIALLDPLPGVALLPLAILWLGTGEMTTVFIIVHSVLWPISRSIVDGFRSAPAVYVESGQNLGLSPLRLVFHVYFPASLPSVLSGLRVGWARAWRALISAEMIFGVSGAVGGLGWFIYVRRYQMDTAGTFAALAVIMVIGILVERLLLGKLERHTVKKWGMVKDE